MKKLLLSSIACFSAASMLAQIKYVDPIYAESTVQITKNVQYATHISVLPVVLQTGGPAPENLTMDLYSSTGNTDAAKPLIIFLHTGNFLPRYGNNLPTGARDDSATVAFCKKLAQRGYVVAAMSYRLGWNPISQIESERRETIINAAYRGVQDLAACVRFFKKSVKAGNAYAIDSTKIAVGGQGTGGYITLAYATLDRQSETRLEKFYNLDVKRWMVQDSALMGDRLGFKIPGTPSALVIENHKGHTSNVQIAFNFGGALGDSSWLEKGSLPIISVHGIQDPFAPYNLGIVSVPGTTSPLNVVDVSGSFDVMKRTNNFGNNASYKGKVNDVYTLQANKLNKGYDGLFPIAGAANGSGPYEWWDTAAIKALGVPNAAKVIANGNASNPLHKIFGKTRAMLYIDSMMGYVAPRLAVSMGLVASVGINKTDLASNVTVAPNPATSQIIIHNNWNERKLISAELVDMNGRVIQNMQLNSDHNVVDLKASAGVYMLRLNFNDGVGMKKLVIN
jgi:hypothetical protein